MARTPITRSTWIRALTYTPTGGGVGRVVLETHDGALIVRTGVPSWVPGLVAAGWPAAGDEPSSVGRAAHRFGLVGKKPVPRPASPWTSRLDTALATRRRLVAKRRAQSPWTRPLSA